MALVLLEIFTDDTLMNGLPTQQEVQDYILEQQRQEAPIYQALNELSKEDQIIEYDKLFSYDIRHTFIIEFTQEEWDGLNQDMWDYYAIYGTFKSNNYRKVDVTYIADDEITYIEDVGIRSKGNDYSRRPPQEEDGTIVPIHYMMKFNETFDTVEGSDECEDLKTRDVFNLEQLLFKWNNTGDPSYTNEIFSYEMFRQAGVPIPSASWAELQIVIDGEVQLTTLYKVFEQMDEEFVRKHLQETPQKQVGDLYKGLWSATLDPITDSSQYGIRDWENNYRPLYGIETNKDNPDYSSLVDFSYGINIEDTQMRKNFIEEYFNVDSFMRAMAVNVLVGNPDDYRGNANNFYYYFDEEGYMTYLPFDYDNSMGSGWAGHDGFINYTLGNDIYEWNWPIWMPVGKPLWDNTINYTEYQILYEDYLMEFIESGMFSEATYLEMFNQTQSLYGDTFYLRYDKADYIQTKIAVVTEDVEYYRSQR